MMKFYVRNRQGMFLKLNPNFGVSGAHMNVHRSLWVRKIEDATASTRWVEAHDVACTLLGTGTRVEDCVCVNQNNVEWSAERAMAEGLYCSHSVHPDDVVHPVQS